MIGRGWGNDPCADEARCLGMTGRATGARSAGEVDGDQVGMEEAMVDGVVDQSGRLGGED